MLDTLEHVKDRLGITTDDDDAFLTQQIELISDVIESYCRRIFTKTTWKQTFYGDDTLSRVTALYHYPIAGPVSIKKDGEVIAEELYRPHKPSAMVTFLRGFPFIFPGQSLEVTYDAGYETIPRPILSVLDSVVGERYNKKKSGVNLDFGSDVQRISIPGAISIDFDYSLSNNDADSRYGTILGNHVNVLMDWRSERTVLGSGKLEYVESST